MKDYIKRIEGLLQKTGWTQQKLAETLGVTHAALSRWINGHATPQQANLSRLEQLCREHVGVTEPSEKNYAKFLKSIERFRYRDLPKVIRNNLSLIDELVVGASYNSNRMEGTSLSFRETQTLILDRQMSPGKPYSDHLVISHHANALRDLLTAEELPPLTESLIKEWHKRLFDGIRDDAGRYSRFQRGILGLNIQLTHPEDIPEEMKGFISRMRRLGRKKISLENIAESHASFELIHPFGDGNGRVGRLIIVHQCLQAGLGPIIIRETRKAVYYDALEEAQRRSVRPLTVFLFEELEESAAIIKKYGV